MSNKNYKMSVRLLQDGHVKSKLEKIADISRKYQFVPYIENNTIQIIGTGLPEDFGRMGVLVEAFERAGWFISSIEEWLFYDSYGSVTDMVEEYGKGWKTV